MRPSASIPGYGQPVRLQFADDEARLSWLTGLLEAYYLADQGISQGLTTALRQGRRLACAQGCANCCRSHTEIPVYPLELVGIYWYVTEQLPAPLRNPLKHQLRQHRRGEPCPFLLDERCAIHPLRPLACRHFNVFDTPCAPGEDAYHSRRADVFDPPKKYREAAFAALLPFQGITGKLAQRKAIDNGALLRFAQVLQTLAWDKLAIRMESWDAHSPS